MPTAIFLDIAVVVIVLGFFIGGLRLGFVRGLCSFLAFFVALLGAMFCARFLTPPLAEFLEPQVLPSLVQRLENAPIPPSNESLDSTNLSHLLQSISLPTSWADFLAYGSESNDEPLRSPSEFLAFSMLKMILSAVIFSLSFLIILLLWRLLSRSLDFLANLPVLSFFNRLLGGLFGLLKATIVLFLLRWAVFDLLGLLPLSVWNQSVSGPLLSQLFDLIAKQPFFLFS